jgi:hypothetical protein
MVTGFASCTSALVFAEDEELEVCEDLHEKKATTENAKRNITAKIFM